MAGRWPTLAKNLELCANEAGKWVIVVAGVSSDVTEVVGDGGPKGDRGVGP